MDNPSPLKVFLCHASTDTPKTRELYRYLRRWGIQPWFDEVDLIGGQHWQIEIPKALETSDIIIICFTKNSVDKEGYIQKEIKFALDKALEMPEGQIFLIPVKFEECEIPFTLREYQWVDLSAKNGYSKLMKALKFRASYLGRTIVELPKTTVEEDSSKEYNKISKERVLEAAIEKQVIVGKPASLFVWVRRYESENIISVVSSTDEYVHLDEDNVKTKDLKIEFPIKNGQVLPAEITLRLVAHEFTPSLQQKKIYVPPKGDSEVCTFVVTPKKTGELLLSLEVLKDEVSLGNKNLRTTAIDKEKKVDNRLVLMTIPIVVLVQAPVSISNEVKPINSKEEGNAVKVEAEKPPTNVFPWTAILGFFGAVLVAYIGFLGVRSQIEVPIEATQTAEARLLTLTAQVSLSPTVTPQPTLTPIFTSTPYVCPFQGQTDHETIVNLIRAEATAVNNKDFNIILKIFSSDAEFYDYDVPPSEPPKTWKGPLARYKNNLFMYTEFQGVQHLKITSVGPGIDDKVAYYVSGSSGSYRSDSGDWTNFNNPSIPDTQYGSDHWVLQKDNNGCWVIIRMEFNAGHIKFP